MVWEEVFGYAGRRVAPEPVVAACIYQLRIVLCDISPLIWRRLWVRSDTCLADLHAVLQMLMNWSDTDLHRFRVHGKDYGMARLGDIGFADDPRQVRLADLRLHRGERFLYEYDFHDGWVLEIPLEDRLALDAESNCPICTAGRRAAPRGAVARGPTWHSWSAMTNTRLGRLSRRWPPPCNGSSTSGTAPLTAIWTPCGRRWLGSKRTRRFSRSDWIARRSMPGSGNGPAAREVKYAIEAPSDQCYRRSRGGL